MYGILFTSTNSILFLNIENHGIWGAFGVQWYKRCNYTQIVIVASKKVLSSYLFWLRWEKQCKFYEGKAEEEEFSEISLYSVFILGQIWSRPDISISGSSVVRNNTNHAIKLYQIQTSRLASWGLLLYKNVFPMCFQRYVAAQRIFYPFHLGKCFFFLISLLFTVCMYEVKGRKKDYSTSQITLWDAWEACDWMTSSRVTMMKQGLTS